MGRLLEERRKAMEETGARPLFYMDRRCTVCLLVVDSKVLARGVAICSPLDDLDRAIGRNCSLGRATLALAREESSLEVVPRKIRTAVRNGGYWGVTSHGSHLRKVIWDKKSYYMPIVLPVERELIEKKQAAVAQMAERPTCNR